MSDEHDANDPLTLLHAEAHLDFKRRIEALEAQVRELQGWVDGIELGALHAAMQDVTPETHGTVVKVDGDGNSSDHIPHTNRSFIGRD